MPLCPLPGLSRPCPPPEAALSLPMGCFLLAGVRGQPLATAALAPVATTPVPSRSALWHCGHGWSPGQPMCKSCPNLGLGPQWSSACLQLICRAHCDGRCAPPASKLTKLQSAFSATSAWVHGQKCTCACAESCAHRLSASGGMKVLTPWECQPNCSPFLHLSTFISNRLRYLQEGDTREAL